MRPVFCLLLIALAIYIQAQHQHNNAGMSDSSMKQMQTKKSMHKNPTPQKHMSGDTTKPGRRINMDTMQHGMHMDGMGMHDTMKHGMGMEQMNMSMSHAFSRNLPMSRDGSGTSWIPDASPMYMYMAMKDKYMFMIHGNIFLRYTKQDLFNNGSRGGHLGLWECITDTSAKKDCSMQQP